MKKNEWLVTIRKNWTKFKTENSKILNHMCQEFERKKSAQELRRTQFNKTGVINTNKLPSFKWNENIFKKNEIRKDGKNHGIIMLVDCSGSMSGKRYLDTIKQSILLTNFCRKVKIEYKVMGFNDVSGNFKNYKNVYLNKNSNHLKIGGFNIREWLNSDMNNNQHEMVCTYLLGVSSGKFPNYDYSGFKRMYFNYKRGNSYLANEGDIPCSTTPLDDSLIILRQISDKFKKDKNIDVLNTVILTDGASNTTTLKMPNSTYSRSGNRINSYDPFSGKWFRAEKINTQTILNFYKNCIGGNIIGFFINGWKDEEIVYNYEGYDVYFSVSSFSMEKGNRNNGDFSNIDEIKNDFERNQRDMKNSKKILTELIKYLA